MAEEKETKYRLDPGQADQVAAMLAGIPSQTFRLVDRYYDLRDRVVRLRWQDGKPRLTLKSAPRWEGTTKIREEWEEALPEGQDEIIDRLMTFLGYGVRAEIPKTRTAWRTDGVEVAHDRLDGVPEDFLEIEGDGEAIAAMAARLGLRPDHVESRSYLSIWLNERR